MPNPIKTALDSARKIAKDPATNAKLKSGIKDGASTVLKKAKDPATPAKIKTGLKDGSAWVANRAHPAVLRLSHGKIGAKLGDAPVLLLTTTGRKSGKSRTVPLCYLADGDSLVLVASYGGDDRSPQWLGNLQADPAVTVEIDGKTTPMTAAVADAEAKARLWPQVVAMYKGYEGYQKKTDRDIPLVVLTPPVTP